MRNITVSERRRRLAPKTKTSNVGNLRPRHRWDYPKTARRGGSSWPGSRARYPSMAPSACCVAVSSKHQVHDLESYYRKPSPGNEKAQKHFV